MLALLCRKDNSLNKAAISIGSQESVYEDILVPKLQKIQTAKSVAQQGLYMTTEGSLLGRVHLSVRAHGHMASI